MHYPATQIGTTGPAGDALLSQGDGILPAQFYPARRGSASVEPILRLMAAILSDAMRCFQRNFAARHAHGRREFREAQFWIFQDKGNGPFSFEDVCHALGIDSRRLRELIVRWEKDMRSGDTERMNQNFPVNIAGRTQSRRGKAQS